MARVAAILAVVVLAVVIAWLRTNGQAPPGVQPGDDLFPANELPGFPQAQPSVSPWIAPPPCPGADAGGGRHELVTHDDEVRLRAGVVRGLRESGDADHLLAVASILEEDDPRAALAVLVRAAGTDPWNPLVAGTLLDLCVRLDADCSLSRQEVEQGLIRAERGNAVAWAKVVHSRLQRNDDAGALAALRRAAAAAEADAHLADYVLVFDRALAAGSDLPSGVRLMVAHGMAAAVDQSELGVYRDCERLGRRSAEWLDACTRLGEKFESEARSLLIRAVGISLQRKMYEIAGDGNARDRVQARYDAFVRRQSELVEHTRGIEWGSNELLARDYLEVLVASGEIEALEFAGDEWRRRVAAGEIAEAGACGSP